MAKLPAELQNALRGTAAYRCTYCGCVYAVAVAMQWRRVPDMHEAIIGDGKFEEILADSVADYEREYGPLTEEAETRDLALSATRQP